MPEGRNHIKPDLTTFDLDTLPWSTSSYSNGAGGMCVEVAKVSTGVLVRDSNNRAGVVMPFSKEEWRAFLDGAKDGEFDI
ncbi:DUF397 domain-containing protein [Frankia sp. Cr1]|uniref:DUF397 domain-containing protein n=1 Tax=Frankia sp. Cr1 TaxID=3073931 RepID=UPI002AD2E0BF|nr:DUF397 domain-containing protein [Frankia sp. Cr1]